MANFSRLAVVGSPIAHSLSPEIQRAAASVLGASWQYDRIEVASGGLGAFVSGLSDDWLGLSVTAPLKEEAAVLASSLDAHAQLTGAANTLLFEEEPRGWNTDVGGIIDAFSRSGMEQASTGIIIGAGATALSALVALASMGVQQVVVSLRNPAKAERMAAVARRLELSLVAHPIGETLPGAEAAVSTLPASAEVVPRFASAPMRLIDADYARDGSRYLAQLDADSVIDGVEMLLAQALLQTRIFVHGSVDEPLRNEAEVVARMRAAVGAVP